ncbi:MAG: hypothetical protein M1541_01190 [Acidobacteria bacterium]|nr:hypothetical protein [Acidobacteriota bacterium]
MITQEGIQPHAETVEAPAPPPPGFVDEVETMRAGEGPRPSTIDKLAAAVGRTERRIREAGFKRAGLEIVNESRDRLVSTMRRKPAVGLGIAAAGGFVAGKLLRWLLGSRPRRECE